MDEKKVTIEKKQKWCYLVFDYSCKDEMGVVKKIKMQVRAISKQTARCDVIYINHRVIEWCKADSEPDIFSFSKQRLEELIDLYDVLYYRFGGVNYAYNNALKRARAKGKINVVEIPTYPMTICDLGVARNRFRTGNIRGAIRLFAGAIYMDEILFRMQKKWMDYVVLSAPDVKVKGVKTINIVNGIEVGSIKKRRINKPDDTTFRLLIVANLSVWHGVDRVIEGMRSYQSGKIEFYIVGDGEAIDEIRNIVERYSMEKKVFFEGKKFGDALDAYFDKCDVAIGSLGLHRLGIKPSTLKSKEYMCRGIPFVASETEKETFDKLLDKYVFWVDGSENPININKLEKWYRSLDLNEAAGYLRSNALEHYSWDKQMEKVIDGVYDIYK